MMLLDTHTVGAIVRRLRDERGYTQGQVVEYTNARLARAGDPLRLTREWLSFVETGRIDEAQSAAVAALAQGTEDATLLYHAGMIAAAAGDSTAARSLLTKALALNPLFSPTQATMARRTLDSLGGGPRV